MAFFSFLLNYYETQILRLENTLSEVHESELEKLLRQASILKKFLQDMKEEGYVNTYSKFCAQIDAVERLEQILTEGLKKLGTQTEAELFYLCREKYRVEFACDSTNAISYEMDRYLEKLLNLEAADLSPEILNLPKYARWLTHVEVVLDEMVRYIQWLLHPSRATHYLFLLRDTLLPYIGVRLKSSHEAIALLISRKYLGTFGDSAQLFDMIMDPIYTVLEFDNPNSWEAFQTHYRTRINQYDSAEFVNLVAGARRYLQSNLKQKDYTVVESGVQGSFPLFLSAIAEQTARFKMYTTVPWFESIYQSNIFNANYNYLRDMETLLSHDSLYQFETFKDGKVIIKEFQNPELKTLAYYEIVRLKEKLGCI